MRSNIIPIPVNEMERILNLYEFDIDYSNLQSTFKDLTQLAAKISGTDISLVNLIDTYTQWSVSNFGLEIEQMAREDSVCQYTILEDDHLEVEDLSADTRFQDKSYVNNPLNLRYYLGVPLKTSSGHHIGALCVLDKNMKKLSDEKIEFLKLIASEIITKLNNIKLLKNLQTKVMVEKEFTKKVAHDIRGPISGIIGISTIIEEDAKDPDILSLAQMIAKSGHAVLDLADEILSPTLSNKCSTVDQYSLSQFKEKLEKLYQPLARAKGVEFQINLEREDENQLVNRDKLLQITGNLIANAIKFTPKDGAVLVNLKVLIQEHHKLLRIEVIDSGIRLSEEANQIIDGKQLSSTGTDGELGYGFGLGMVKNLTATLKGSFMVQSEPGNGLKFIVDLPIISTGINRITGVELTS